MHDSKNNDDYSLSERVYQLIIRKLLSNEYEPGQKVTEAAIAIELGISRGPIREAFKRLSEDRILMMIPRKGCFVPKIDENEVYEIFGIRQRLECYALELAYEHLSHQRLSAFRKSFTAGYDFSSKSDLQRFLTDDNTFHTFIAEQSNATNLCAIISKLNLKIQVYRYRGSLYGERLKPALEEHLAIIDALLAGNLGQAVEHLKNHIKNSKTNFLKHEFSRYQKDIPSEDIGTFEPSSIRKQKDVQLDGAL